MQSKYIDYLYKNQEKIDKDDCRLFLNSCAILEEKDKPLNREDFETLLNENNYVIIDLLICSKDFSNNDFLSFVELNEKKIRNLIENKKIQVHESGSNKFLLKTLDCTEKTIDIYNAQSQILREKRLSKLLTGTHDEQEEHNNINENERNI